MICGLTFTVIFKLIVVNPKLQIKFSSNNLWYKLHTSVINYPVTFYSFMNGFFYRLINFNE